jgi:hypothetical protein
MTQAPYTDTVYTPSDSLAIQLINTKWTKQHKLAMCVMYEHSDQHTEAIYNQLMYLQAKDDESRIWNAMTTDDYIQYLRILETFQGDN